MANKRELKKQIKYICGDVAMQCIITREFVEGVDAEKMNDLVFQTADLQSKSLANATFSFDKTPSDFPTLKEYHKAAHAYFHAAYTKFYEEFDKQIQAILKQLNEALPAAQRELNKKIAAAK